MFEILLFAADLAGPMLTLRGAFGTVSVVRLDCFWIELANGCGNVQMD